MSPRRQQVLVIGLAAAGLIVRLVVAVALPVTPSSDSLAYHQLASHLADGAGFQIDGHAETVWAPGYPALVATVYAITGKRVVAVYLLQAFLDVGACLLLWWWTRRRAGANVAAWALALSIISVSAIASVRTERTESLAAWLLVAAMALIDLSRGHRREALLLACAGAVLGVLTLSRWQFSLFPLLVAGALAVDRRWRQGALVIAAYALTLTPWLMRNYHVLGVPVLSTQTGITFYASHFRNPGQPWGNNTYDATTIAASKMDPVAGNNFLVTETVHRLEAHPSLLVKTYPEKLFFLMVPFDWELLRDRRTLNPTYLLFAILALVGARAAWRDDRRWFIALMLPLGYLVIMTLPFYGSPRFRLPTEPLLAPIAALGLVRIRGAA